MERHKKKTTNSMSETIRDILKIVGIESVTGTPGVKKCLDKISEIATQLGFESEIHANGKVLIINPKKTNGRAKLGFVLHVDTVPFNENEWTHNPLGSIENGRIYGRGVIDDKGAIILVLRALKELENEIPNSWQVIIGTSEEGDWDDMSDYLAENPTLPEFLVTVDGDGICYGCRGYCDLEISFRRRSNTNFYKYFGVLNGANNMVPSKVIVETGNGIPYTFEGVAAHSSEPALGKNAIIYMGRSLHELNLKNGILEYNKMFEFLSDLYDRENETDVISGTVFGFKENEEVPTVFSPTNIVMTKSGTVKINLNLRLGSTVDRMELYTAIGNIALKYSCKVSIGELRFPSAVSKDSREIRCMVKAYEKVMKKKVKPAFAMGIGYNAALPNCAIFGPRFDIEDDEADTCHGKDENRRIDDLQKFYDMLIIFLKEVYKK